MGSNLTKENKDLLPDTYTLTGNDLAILAARISYFLDLKGPSITVNTACSSSLVSVHLGCESLQSGTSDLVIAGGTQILHTPECHVVSSRLGFLSSGDKCRTFDDEADGFVPGEGVGVVVLKRLNEALEDGDHIYGVISGCGINQDGETSGITAPSAPSQAALEKEVYNDNDINPETISYVEAHGTGTKLGDPIEIEALTESFREYTSKKQFCAVGSVKTNIGHAMGAAGIAGLIKVLLCIKNKKLVPSLNFEQENEMIDFETSPFYVNTEVKDWEPSNLPRKAAINSFGFSGTNAHMVIRELYEREQNKKTGSAKPYYLIPVSAKTETALDKKLEELANWIGQKGKKQDIKDISYTLFVGRTQFPLRIALIAEDTKELKTKIKEALQNKNVEKDLINLDQENRVKKEASLEKYGEELIKQLGRLEYDESEYRDMLVTLAKLYVKRYELSWENIYKGERCYLISMPTYPFERESYWLPQTDE
jgi:acyl transferase domain-containing protein